MSTSMAGQNVVVPGGTGNVGEGVVRAALRAGANVIVPSAHAERLTELRGLIGSDDAANLYTRTLSYYDFDQAISMAESIASEFGRIDHVVAIAGGWWNGKKVWDITQEDWQKAFVGPATTHMALVRALVPKLSSNGSYTTIAGFSAHEAYPDSGIVSMQGAAQLMMRRALSVELKHVDSAKRANELMLGPVINRSRPDGKDNWLTADQVGQAAVAVMSRADITNQEVDIQTTERLAAFLEG